MASKMKLLEVTLLLCLLGKVGRKEKSLFLKLYLLGQAWWYTHAFPFLLW